jgi:hypothetical protein
MLSFLDGGFLGKGVSQLLSFLHGGWSVSGRGALGRWAWPSNIQEEPVKEA